VAALLPAMMLGLAGCHHKQPVVAYQPPPPVFAPSSGERPARPSGSNRLPGVAVTTPTEPPTPHGNAISVQTGMASWYGPPYVGAKAADGSVYDQNAMTAANRELPLGSIVRVTNLANNQTVVVRINDHGPFYADRIIDLSLAAAKAIGVYRTGVAKVRIEAYAPPGGYDAAGKWCVQIGVFLDPADSIQLKNDLMRRYATAKVREYSGATGHWVRIDPPNQDRATADRIAASIHIPDPGTESYLVRLN
jgi:rare lipoprotein A